MFWMLHAAETTSASLASIYNMVQCPGHSFGISKFISVLYHAWSGDLINGHPMGFGGGIEVDFLCCGVLVNHALIFVKIKVKVFGQLDLDSQQSFWGE